MKVKIEFEIDIEIIARINDRCRAGHRARRIAVAELAKAARCPSQHIPSERLDMARNAAIRCIERRAVEGATIRDMGRASRIFAALPDRHKTDLINQLSQEGTIKPCPMENPPSGGRPRFAWVLA